MNKVMKNFNNSMHSDIMSHVAQEYTGLYCSVQQNKINCVRLYLQLGADITIKDQVSNHSTCECPRKKPCKILYSVSGMDFKISYSE